MVRRRGPRLTAAQKTELWRRWRRGESLNAIGRALGRIAHVVRYEVARTGGIPPLVRQRSRLALTLPEREAISRGLASGMSVRQISRQLCRAPSTVGREIGRHGGRRRYRAATADSAAWARGRRPKRCRLATYPALRDAVAIKLARKWSPQQIAGWLRQAYSDDPTMHVSHETIYVSLFVQSRGVLKQALQAQLRQRRTMRRPRAAAPKTGGYIVGAVSIRERPATVEDRAVPGHWEGDLIAGARQSYVATLVERRSRYVCLVRVAGRTTRTVIQALTEHVRAVARGPHGHVDLGSRPGTRGPSHVLDRDRRAGLFLRPVQSVAARDQREHEWFAPPVSAEGDQPRPLHAGAPESDRPRTQHAAPQDTGLSDAGRYTRGDRCIDRLNASDQAGPIPDGTSKSLTCGVSLTHRSRNETGSHGRSGAPASSRSSS